MFIKNEFGFPVEFFFTQFEKLLNKKPYYKMQNIFLIFTICMNFVETITFNAFKKIL